MTASDGVLDILERWRPTLIIVAGILISITAALSALEIVSDITTNLVELSIAPFAFLLLFVGVLSLYSELVDRTPWLTRAGAAFGVLGSVFAPILGIAAIANLAGLLPGEIPVWALGLHLLGRFTGLIALILFSASVFQTRTYSRRIGFLLLGPAAVMSLSFLHIAIGAPQWTVPPLVGANALAMLALGYTLRTEGASTERGQSPVDSPV